LCDMQVCLRFLLHQQQSVSAKSSQRKKLLISSAFIASSEIARENARGAQRVTECLV